jgi:hypothetical protein
MGDFKLMCRRVAVGLAIVLASNVCISREALAEFSVAELATGVGTTGGGNPMIGWEFKATAEIQVTKLGFYDSGQDGLLTSHTLGLFDAATQSLLASVTISAGSVAPIEGPLVILSPAHPIPIGGFRYVNIPPALLPAGHDYVVGATAAGYVDSTANYSPTRDVLQTASEIMFVQGRYTFFGPQGFQFPANVFPSADFGPAFEFNAVPEPSAVVLLAWAFVGLFAAKHLWRQH